MNELLVDLRDQYTPIAQENFLKLRLYTGIAGTHAVSDPVLLKRLLGNLISNALRNTQRGGVLLALRQSAGHWRIEVWDTGIGVDSKYQDAIFNEFYRIPRQGTEEGFGLGLTIAKRLSQVLGCSLQMHSRPGRGSVFRIEQEIVLKSF